MKVIPDSELDPRLPDELESGSPFSSYATKESRRSGAVLAGRYQVRGFLERGAHARIYLAEDLTTGTPVALKILAPETALSPEFRIRLLREGRAMKAISHPNVATVLEAGETEEGVPFLAMEALLGESLGEYVRRETIPLDTALILLRQAASGLAAAHRAGIVHRDVKPDNFLLLGPPGEPYGLKVIDFGLAKLWDVDEAGGEAHNVMGTAEYMSPEQILAEHVDARSDIYSLGVVMFRVFSGHLPFESVGQADLLRHQLFSTVPPPSWLNESLDARVDRVVQMATQKDRDRRYANMDDLIADLEVLIGIHNRELRARSLSNAPDAYLPSTDLGRQAASVLAAKFGEHATRPGSSKPPGSG
ncbi:MAG TPA: serine/threonine-protein kinase [Polyangiaceae bacterium]|nr:serine/threonine-protein kinase [Polyangiaceae bacterium]